MTSQDLPKQEEFEKALITSIRRNKTIYPSIYKRRFNIPLKNIIEVMNKLSAKGVVSLRFKIESTDYSSNISYKLGKLPETVFNEETDEEIEVTSENITPVYEVITNCLLYTSPSPRD